MNDGLKKHLLPSKLATINQKLKIQDEEGKTKLVKD
jgi:hypothetical protein